MKRGFGWQSLYGDERNEEGTVKATSKGRDVPVAQLREEKQRILAGLLQQYAQLKAEWGGNTEYDAWFKHELNNARLNAVATYYNLVPGFEHLLAVNGGDLEQFYVAAERLSKMPKKDRRRWLTEMGQGQASSAQTP